MNSIRVRPAKASDAAEVAQVLRASTRELGDTDHAGDRAATAMQPSQKTPDDIKRWIAEEPDLIFVAERDGRVIGVATATLSGELKLDWVCPTARFQDAGRAFLRRLEAELAGRGISETRLVSTRTRMRFYQAEGWKCSGAPVGDAAMSGILMTKALPAVRRLDPAEARLWRRIRLEALSTAPSAFSSTYSDWADRPLKDFQLRLASATVLVAEFEHGVVACAVLSPDDSPANPQRGWLESVFVSPKARGRGVGAALVAGVVAQARCDGLTELMLDVGVANQSARQLYHNAGFERLVERPPGSDERCEMTLWLSLIP